MMKFDDEAPLKESKNDLQESWHRARCYKKISYIEIDVCVLAEDSILNQVGYSFRFVNL